MTTETIVITHKKAAEGKVLTNGTDYVHEIFLAPFEPAASWQEVDPPAGPAANGNIED